MLIRLTLLFPGFNHVNTVLTSPEANEGPNSAQSPAGSLLKAGDKRQRWLICPLLMGFSQRPLGKCTLPQGLSISTNEKNSVWARFSGDPSKCGPSSSSSTWELARDAHSPQHHLDLPRQNTHFNKIPRAFMSSLKLKKRSCTNVHSSTIHNSQDMAAT